MRRRRRRSSGGSRLAPGRHGPPSLPTRAAGSGDGLGRGGAGRAERVPGRAAAAGAARRRARRLDDAVTAAPSDSPAMASTMPSRRAAVHRDAPGAGGQRRRQRRCVQIDWSTPRSRCATSSRPRATSSTCSPAVDSRERLGQRPVGLRQRGQAVRGQRTSATSTTSQRTTSPGPAAATDGTSAHDGSPTRCHGEHGLAGVDRGRVHHGRSGQSREVAGVGQHERAARSPRPRASGRAPADSDTGSASPGTPTTRCSASAPDGSQRRPRRGWRDPSR